MRIMERVCHWITARMAPPRVIFDREGVSPYLSRYYIIGKPHMPDGSDPFASDGAPKVGVIWPDAALGVYLHRFHRGDDDQELHCHPWRWAASLILSGGYHEERRVRGTDHVIQQTWRPGMVNFIGSEDFHRVDLRRDGEGNVREAWSLFVVGRKFSGWGFWNRLTDTFTPWREFINAKRDATAFARPS